MAKDRRISALSPRAWAGWLVTVAVVGTSCGTPPAGTVGQSGSGSAPPASALAVSTAVSTVPASSAMEVAPAPVAVPSGARSPETSAAHACPAIDPADTSTAAGWLGYLATHQGDVSVIVDDGRGERVEHRPDQPAPAASAAKVVHLAAYADAIDAGRVSPEQPITIADWEDWFLPGLDGGAHGRALQALGIANDGGRATDPAGRVPLDDVVTAMVQFSDNAAADFLRQLLGDEALRAAAAEFGAENIELPSYLGEFIGLLSPGLVPGPSVSRAEFAAAELALAQRYAADPAFRAEVATFPAPALDPQFQWAETSSTTTALALEAVHTGLSKAADDPTRPGAANARRHLEWPAVPPGSLGLGAKGGSLPGVITEAMTLRRPDGSTASAVLLVRRMPASDWTTGLSSFAHQELLLAAMQDPAVLDRLSCAVGAGSTIPG